MVLEFEKSIQQKLDEELRSRNKRLFIPHLMALIASVFICKDMYSERLWIIFPQILIASSLLLRFTLLNFFFTRYVRRDLATVLGFHLGVMTTGLGWGLFYYYSALNSGVLSFQSTIGLGMILVMMSGAVTALSTSVRMTVLFLISLAIIPVLHLLSTPSSEAKVVALLVLGNFIFHIYHARISHQYLLSSVKNELKESKQRESYQQVIDAIPALVLMIGEDGQYLMVNNFARDKYPRGQDGKRIVFGPYHSPIEDCLKDFIKSKKTTMVKEIATAHQEGEEWWMVNLKRITQPAGIIAVASPITDIVKTRTELKAQEARAQYSAKLASLGEMAAGIAHEINNPLTIIEGASTIMNTIIDEGVSDLPTLKLMIRKISDTTQRISKIVKSLKTLSRKDEDEVSTFFSLRSVLDPCLEISAQKIKSLGIELRLPEGTEESLIYGREIQITQVLMNLISNSIDATQESKTRWIEIRYQARRGYCDITVSDSGPGVSAEIAERIMEPFFTTKDINQGTGLGLSISKNIVDSHGGELHYLEHVPHTTFKMRLPFPEHNGIQQ